MSHLIDTYREQEKQIEDSCYCTVEALALSHGSECLYDKKAIIATHLTATLALIDALLEEIGEPLPTSESQSDIVWAITRKVNQERQRICSLLTSFRTFLTGNQ